MKIEECDCDGKTFIGHFWLNEVERKGMYCEKCGNLLDYIPQYETDGVVK